LRRRAGKDAAEVTRQALIAHLTLYEAPSDEMRETFATLLESGMLVRRRGRPARPLYDHEGPEGELGSRLITSS
jgi:hypothetical protein